MGAGTLRPVTDATIVGDDPVLESLGAFLAASLLSQPAPVAPVVLEAAPPVALLIEPMPSLNRADPVSPVPVPNRPVESDLPDRTDETDQRGETDRADEAEQTDRADEAEQTEDIRQAPSRTRVTVEWMAIILAALTVAIVIRVVVIQSFVIPSESMHPTLQANDRVLVNRLAYRAHPIRRGDVIVFDRPKSAALGPGTPAHLIKRVIALPGDTIVARNGVVYIDGRRLREPYLPAGTLTENLNTSITIPAGHVWVMGDNRMNSTDSRIFGAIDVKLVVGRAFARIWPPSRIGFL
jgi:signal peptidase I